MDEKELEALYKAMSDKFDVGNYDTFKSKMQTPDDRKRFYDAVGDQGFDLGDYNEYEKRLGGVKKKVGSIDFEKSSLQSGNTASSPSPLPSSEEDSIDPYDIIGNIEEAKKLENAGNFVVGGGTGGAAGSFVPDLEAQKKSKDIIGNIKKQGYTDEDVKGLYDDFKDFPKQAHELQITRADGTINTPYTKAALLDLRRSNPLRYKQLIGTIKNEFDIINVAGIREGNNYNRLNQYNSLQEYYGNKQKQIGMINTYLTGEKKDKALARLYENSSPIINTANPELLEEYNTSEFKDSLDPNQFAGLKTLEIFKPNQYKQAVNILKTKIIPQYNVSINPSDMGIAPPVPGGGLPTTYQTTDKSKGGKLAQETISQQVGQEEIKRALTDIGRNNAMMFAKKEMDGINSVYDDATPEGKSALQLEYLKHNFTLVNSQEDSKRDVERFPLTSQMKFDQQVKEYTQKEMGALGYGALKFLQGFKKTGDTIENLATELFGSDDDKTLLQIKRIGELKRDQNEMYLPENLKMEGSPVIPEFSKELKSKADEILKNNDLSEYEKDTQLATLFKNNQDKIDYVTNPNAGKHKNFFSKANLYENAGMMGDIASLAAQSMGLGMLGAGKLVTSALPMFTTAQSDYYREAVANGEPNPMAYANLHATIMAAAGLINPKLDIVKKAFGMNTALGKTLAGVSEETWDKVISAKKPLIDKLINSASTVTKEAGKMGAVYGFGTSVANDVADKMFFDKPITSDEIINNAVKSTKHLMYSSAGLFGLTALTNFKSVSPMEKSRLWELGDNKEIAIKEIDEAVLKGEITPQQGEARKKITKDISGIIDKIPTENSKGKVLTDKQRLDYFYNDLIKNKANEAKSNLPTSQAEKAEHTALVADFKNDYILEPKTDKQLESRKNQLEKSLEPKKDAEGKTIEPNEKEVKEAKAELEAINDIIENKPKEEVDTKLSEPIEGLDEQGVPIGDNVPSPTKPEAKTENGVSVEPPQNISEPIPLKNEAKTEVPENTIQAESEGVVNAKADEVEQATAAGGQKPPIEPPKNTDAALSGEEGSGDKKGLDKLAANIPNNNVVREYMSKDTIEKYTGETPQNNQEIIKQELLPALLHGEKVIEKSKEVFGDDYVEKLLDYVEKEALPIQNKALLYISLENALAKEKLENPVSVERINKLQKLVYSKSQAFSRENALALNMARLRKIAEVGYDISKITDQFFSSKELQNKSDIEKALESDADTINKEAEIKENDSAQAIADENARIEKLVEEGVSKEVDKIYKSLPTSRRQKADKAIAVLESIQKKLRGKVYDAGLGVPVAIIDAGITTIKSAIKAGVKVADAIELGIKKIKEKYGKKWEKEEEFRKDMLEGFIDGKIDVNDSGQSNTTRLKDILIEAGFSRNTTIKGEKRKILDWKKLAGEEGSIDRMKESVEKVLTDRGMSKEGIKEMQNSLIDEYNDLRASVIEKSMNELARRNKETVTPEQKGAAKKLAELYNYELFDKDTAEYDKLINTAIGSSISPEGFEQAKKIANAMQTLYSSTFKGKKLNDISSKTAIQQLENNLRQLLAKEAKTQGNNNYRIANIVRNYMDISQTMVLNNLKQAVENPFSGLIQNTFEKISGELSKEGIGTKEMAKQRNVMMKTIYKDMLVNGGIGYGDVNHQFANRAKLDDYVNKLSDNQLYHGITSVLTGKATLDAMDAMFKQSITEKKFAANLIKILTHESNKNRMPKEEAIKFVSEKLTGQTFKDAQKTAKEVIEKINKDAGEELVSTSQTSIDRLANDIVKSALEMGEKLTTEQINAAYKAAYKAAGEGLGHEANNPLSAMVTGYTGKIEKEIQNAVKEKDWNKAAYLTYESTIWRNMINPFVGGGTNWLILKLEKTGLGLFTGLYYRKKYLKDGRIDLSSEQGVKNLDKALYNQALYKDKFIRGAIGGGASILTYLAFMGVASTDGYREWRNKNKWAKRYLDTFTPEFLLAQMSVENKELARYFEGVLNKNDSFDATTKLIKGIWDAEKGDKERMWGALGEVMGSKFNFPLPWRLVKDGQVLYQGVTGKDPYNGDYSPSVGGWNGLFKGGLIEYLGYRPEKSK